MKKKTILVSMLIVCSLFFCIKTMCNDTKDKTPVQYIEPIKVEIPTPTIEPIIISEDVIEEDNDEEIAAKYEELMYLMEESENLEEWYMTYKDFMDSVEIDKPETIYDCFSESELNLLFRVVQAELDDRYSFEQKVHVANVIFNRVEHERFPNTLSEILIPGQFSTISNGRYKKVEVSEKTILACEFAYEIADLTDGCLFFDSNGVLKYQLYKNDGAHNLYKLKER